MDALTTPNTPAAIANGSAIRHTMTGAYKVGNLTAGACNTRVSSQWYSRPDDQKFLSLGDLHAHALRWADASRMTIIHSKDIVVEASREDEETLALVMPDTQQVVVPTHWSMSQLCSLTTVPAGYIRRLPAFLAGINLQYGLKNLRSEAVKAYIHQDGPAELRAATGPDYGRIFDHEVVSAVRKIAGDGTGDTRWKVPGVLDWNTHMYDPFAPVTKESTTLFASDRDVFLFLVDDTHPIEIGTLPNGDPDLLFRGFYAWNSEVGSRSFGLATFYMRGVCQNRILWGVEGHQEISLRHSKEAPTRFAAEAAPALLAFADSATDKLLSGIKDARAAVVAKDADERSAFLTKRGFSKGQVGAVLAAVEKEEGHPAASVWDFVQGITAVARSQGHQDARIEMERSASRLLEKVAS